jgi:hypothetical protein
MKARGGVDVQIHIFLTSALAGIYNNVKNKNLCAAPVEEKHDGI